ncbi:MAG: dienelactone hydrolase family protein [Candidatus Rokuibacteriota bacterium]
MVVLHEASGLLSPVSDVPEVCDRLGREGFDAVAPDLFDGATATEVPAAIALMKALSPERAMHGVDEAVGALRSDGLSRVVVLGFCMGGGLAFRAALERPELAGAVVFYGTPRGDLESLRVPVLGHFALDDRFVSLDDVRTAEARLRSAGTRFELHYYEAEHAFMNEKMPAYSAPCAAVAWQRTLAFLRGLT